MTRTGLILQDQRRQFFATKPQSLDSLICAAVFHGETGLVLTGIVSVEANALVDLAVTTSQLEDVWTSCPCSLKGLKMNLN